MGVLFWAFRQWESVGRERDKAKMGVGSDPGEAHQSMTKSERRSASLFSKDLRPS